MERCLGQGGALEGALRLKRRGLVRNVGFGMRPHDFHRQAIATGDVDVLLCFNDYNLLRQTAAEGVLPAAAGGRRRGAERLLDRARLLTGADVDAAAARGHWGARRGRRARPRDAPAGASTAGSACCTWRCSSACASSASTATRSARRTSAELEANVAGGDRAAAGGGVRRVRGGRL